MNTTPFHTIAVIGLGLIGGSLCRALRRVFPGCSIVGVDHRPVIDLAHGVLDHGFTPDELPGALARIDLLFLAPPVDTILRLLPDVARYVPAGAVVTDVGSTKAQIVEAACRCFGRDRYFIGGHPMAGHVHSGWHSSDAYLFENAAYILTPDLTVPANKKADLAALLQALGAHVIEMDSGTHDRVAAQVSHLPQLLAVALMNYVARADGDREARLRLAAGGFRDMTRIASSPFAVWRDILHTNRTAISSSLREFRDHLERLANDLDGEGMEPAFAAANQGREQIPQDTRGFLQPHFDLSVVAPDRPGALAAIASALAAENINIKDIEVVKVREGEGGSLRLAFDSHHSRKRALELLCNLGFPSQPRG